MILVDNSLRSMLMELLRAHTDNLCVVVLRMYARTSDMFSDLRWGKRSGEGIGCKYPLPGT